MRRLAITELSHHLVSKPSGCRLMMQGTFATSLQTKQLHISISATAGWGTILTWTTEHAHAMNIALAIAAFEQVLSESYDNLGGSGGCPLGY